MIKELDLAVQAKYNSDIKEGWLIPICLDEYCEIPDITINSSKHNLKDLHCISMHESNLDNALNDILTHILPKFTVRTNLLPVYKNKSKGINQSFLLGECPFTIGEWLRVKGERPIGGDPNKPVTMVNWKEVQGFIKILNKRNGNKDIKLYRLPSEAEWEYACRAENNGEFGFDGGKERLKDFAWYEKNSGGVTHPVGKLKPNKWGFYDMHGNVCEWVQDTREVEPSHQNEGKDAITKGGSFDGNSRDHCKIDSQMWNPTILKYNNIGFRLAADPADPIELKKTSLVLSSSEVTGC